MLHRSIVTSVLIVCLKSKSCHTEDVAFFSFGSEEDIPPVVTGSVSLGGGGSIIGVEPLLEE